MKSQYEKKRLITFDRIKIKSNYKYLLNTKVKFNEMFHSRSGEKIGIFYSSKDDINIPYNLYIAVSYIKQTLTLEFSSKILKEKYPDLISRDTIKECLTNINQLHICDIDVDSILSNGAITSVDVTYDANLILSDNLLNILNSQVTNYRRFKWAEIGFGEFVSSESVGTYTPFEITINYSNTQKRPAKLTIVAIPVVMVVILVVIK
mgnify:CR=1 FL=1